MSFPRHREIYRSDVVFKTAITWGPEAASRWSAPEPSLGTRRKGRALLIVRDEFPVGYSLAGCSPAEPASASPTGSSMRWRLSAGNRKAANGNLSLISVSQRRGSLQTGNTRGNSVTACAGINRHVVGDERALQERRSDSILTSSLAPVAVRRQAKRRQRHRWAGRLSSENLEPGADPFLSAGRPHRRAALHREPTSGPA